MRRFVAIFLLMLLSLQSIWVAAAPYCQHEESAGLAHVGHHSHEHQGHGADAHRASATDKGKASPASLPSALDHADCHVFHAGCSPLSELVFNFHLRPSADRLALEPLTVLPSPLPHRPERPKWPSLA